MDEIASLYEQYQVRKALIMYCPGVGTTIDGRIRYGIDYVAGNATDPLGNLATTPGQVDKLGGNNHALYTASRLPVNVGTAMKQKWMYVGAAGLDRTAFALSFSNESTEPNPGEFRVQYEIVFKGVSTQGQSGGGNLGSLSGTFIQQTNLTPMNIDTGLFSSAKWGCSDRAPVGIGYSDGAPIPLAVARIAPIAIDNAARQTGPDGASACLNEYNLSLGTGITIAEGAQFAVEVEVQMSEGRGANGENSPDNDTSSGTGGFVPTQWIFAPAEGAGDESQCDALTNCPYVISGVGGTFIVDQELTLISSANVNGNAIIDLQNSAGPAVENPNRYMTTWIGSITALNNLSGAVPLLVYNRSPGAGNDLLKFLMRDVNDNSARVCFSAMVRVRLTAVNTAARKSLQPRLRPRLC
jgi:hypothetical protein